MSEVTAAIGLMQLKRLDGILARRKRVEAWYHEQVQTFEGIKPPYIADGVCEIHWMLYVIHLGKRFTLSARNQIVEDMADAGAIEIAPYCVPLQAEFHFQQLGFARGQFPITDRIADRALALPFHGNLDDDQIKFIVKTLKEACTNVGAGVPIY
jgi:dTDP-4-amino-4,6-dideoxygalactose transaminase